MITLGLKRSGLGRSLKVLQKRGFAAAVVEGVDVAALVAAERSGSVLAAALEAARRHGEKHWQALCAQRLSEVDGGREATLTYATALASLGRLDDAETLSATIPDAHAEDSARQLRAVLHAKRGRIDEAMAAFETLPGGLAGFYPPPAVLPAAEEMLQHCPLDIAAAFVRRLRVLYPDHLLVRSLEVRCLLFEGEYEKARELADVPAGVLASATDFDRRSMRDARAAILAFSGWHNELFEFARDVAREDRSHWSMYSAAAEAAPLAWRTAEYDELIAGIPADRAALPEAMAVRCRWLIDRSRIDEALRLLEALKKVSARLYLNVQIYLAVNHQSRSEVEEAYSLCRQAGIEPLGPTLGYCLFSYYYANSEERNEASLGVLLDQERHAENNPTYWQILLRCLVAAGRVEEARNRYSRLSRGLQLSYKLKPFEMYFDAMDGDDRRARQGWTGFIRRSHHFCVNTRTGYPDTVKLRYVERPQDVLLFTTVFNGMIYLDWFLDHYRALGVDHFFVTDNGSTDGTRERLLEQPDVSVFSNPGSFAASAFGIVWTNHQLQRFGVGHWCFHVDIDEGFVFPGQDRGRSLRDLIAYMDTKGFGTIAAVELDMYPDRLDQPAAEDPFAANCYFDVDYFTTRSEVPPYVMIQGGIRQRMTGLALSMHKSPLVRVSPDVRYIECNHNTTHLPVADVTAALLHYKFVGDMAKRLGEAIGRGEYFGGAISYRRLSAAADRHGWDRSLVSEFTRRYEGAGSIEAAGLISGSADWDGFGR